MVSAAVETRTYRSVDLPEMLRCQILCFLRINYPEGFVGPNRLRKWISSEEEHPSHVVLVEEGVLISHTEVKWKWLEHRGETYKVYGLSGVFTYPAFRGQGFGRRIVEEGTRVIKESDADLGMFHCSPHLGDFYARFGWTPLPQATTLVGDREDPSESPELMMVLFLSDRALRASAAFGNTPLYFGEVTW